MSRCTPGSEEKKLGEMDLINKMRKLVQPHKPKAKSPRVVLHGLAFVQMYLTRGGHYSPCQTMTMQDS